MDLNILRSLVTVLSFVLFLGIIAWTFARARSGGFAEAAELPFQETDAFRGQASSQGLSRDLTKDGGRNE